MFVYFVYRLLFVSIAEVNRFLFPIAAKDVYSSGSKSTLAIISYDYGNYARHSGYNNSIRGTRVRSV